jgi:hypothetical protein
MGALESTDLTATAGSFEGGKVTLEEKTAQD